MTEARCPKCKSKSFSMEDIRETSYYYEVNDGIVTACGGGDGGRVLRTICTCRKCLHTWKRRIEFSIDS